MPTYGSLAEALLDAEELLASSAAFQQRVEAGDATAAKQAIHFGTALIDASGDVGLEVKRPLAILETPEHEYQQDAEGEGIGLVGGGGLILLLTDNARSPESHKLSKLDFVSWTSLVVDQMAEAAGVNDQFPGRLFRLIELHHRTPRNERSATHDFWQCVYEIRYGALGSG